MNDIAFSTFLVLGVALSAMAILLFTWRAAKQREERLASYCAAHNYRLTITKEPAAREITIEANDWRMTSGMRAVSNASSSGSSDWRRETEFVCGKKNPLRKTFALMISGGSSDLDAVPSWVREMAVLKLRAHLGERMRGLDSVRTVRRGRGKSGLLFETETHEADTALELLSLPLAAWRGGLPLYIECSPEGIRFILPDYAIKSAYEIDAAVRIGLALR